MTYNYVESEKYIAVKGIVNATEVAKLLLQNGYEVFIELDDCDVYCVHYAYAKYKGYGNAAFYRVTAEDYEDLVNKNNAENSNEGDE